MSTLGRLAGVARLAGPAALAPLLLLPAPGALAAQATAVRSPGASTGNGARVDSVFAAFDDTRSPGCAVGVRHRGENVLARGYGMADLEHGVPVTPSSVFRIGSVSKQFTAAAVLLLARDGILSLDDPVREWVPGLPDAYAEATLDHLLHHTSGIRDYLGLMTLAGQREEDYYSDREVLEMLARQRALNFRPGSDHLYSNSGYFLLGKVVAAASGTGLRAFARERLFGPLGMESTHFHDRPDHPVPHRAVGYEPLEEGGYRISVTTLPMVGDGGVFTSVRDFFRWLENLERPTVGGEDFARRLARRGVLASGDTIAYARGLRVDRYRGLRRIGHGGSFVGYRAGMVRFPDQRFSAVALCNRSDAEPMEKLRRVAEIYLGPEMAPAEGSGEDEPAEEEEPGAGAGRATTKPSPAPGALRPYAGRYHSAELDATYRIELVDGRLELTAGNRLDGPLEATGERTFERSGITLRFREPEGGRAPGFELRADRVREIGFERIPGGPEACPCPRSRDADGLDE